MLSQFTKEMPEHQTLADLFAFPKEVYPIGRLDKDSEGLLLLTDDGRLQQAISDPAFKLSKTYYVQVEGIPDAKALEDLRQGVVLNDGLTRPAEVSRLAGEPAGLWKRDPPVRYRASIPDCWLEIVIREGRNRQVRRMTAAVGFPTLRLIRFAIGDFHLDDLQPGEFRRVPDDLVKKFVTSLPAGGRRKKRRRPVKKNTRTS